MAEICCINIEKFRTALDTFQVRKQEDIPQPADYQYNFEAHGVKYHFSINFVEVDWDAFKTKK